MVNAQTSSTIINAHHYANGFLYVWEQKNPAHIYFVKMYHSRWRLVRYNAVPKHAPWVIYGRTVPVRPHLIIYTGNNPQPDAKTTAIMRVQENKGISFA